MTRWEYRCETFLDAQGAHNVTPPMNVFLERINKLGAEGWEVYEMMAGVVHLRRQLEDK